MKLRIVGLLCVIASFCTAPLRLAGDEGAKPTKGTVRTDDGLALVYEVRGKGDTALIFLHGWCGDRSYWKNQVGEFANDYRVVAVDQAGHGESGKNRTNWTVASLAADVEALAKALGLKRVILVGHSMGGPVALLAARRMPDRVVAVIGVDTLQNADQKMPEEARQKLLADFEADFKGSLRGGFDGLLGQKADPELKTWVRTRAEGQDAKMAVALMRDLLNSDARAALKESRKPVRCINSGGGYAFFTPTDVAANKKYADFDAVTIDAVGHYPMLEKPAEFNQKLRDVLKEFSTGK
jgi:pimeloyl-ACP methyl ester carboxylesterase